MALVGWKDDPLGTMEAIRMYLYSFGVLQTPPSDELRIKDRRMPALTYTQFRNARKILGVHLEPANKKGLGSWRLPRDWQERLERAGMRIC
jgi:hypothetical protein